MNSMESPSSAKKGFRWFPLTSYLINCCRTESECCNVEMNGMSEYDWLMQKRCCVEVSPCLVPCSFPVDLVCLLPRVLWHVLGAVLRCGSCQRVEQFRDEKAKTVYMWV